MAQAIVSSGNRTEAMIGGFQPAFVFFRTASPISYLDSVRLYGLRLKPPQKWAQI